MSSQTGTTCAYVPNSPACFATALRPLSRMRALPFNAAASKVSARLSCIQNGIYIEKVLPLSTNLEL
jgi:hypothetical protein